jgi:hypothetical protein
MGIERWLRASVAAVLLVGLAGCGDDDGGGETGLGEVTGDGDSGAEGGLGDNEAGGGPPADLCALLETSEVEAEFGERGAVGEGYPEFDSCVWDVGDQSIAGTGNVTVGSYGPAIGQTVEQQFAGYQDLAENPVDIEGLGDEAYAEHDPEAFDDRSLEVMFEHTFVYFRSGETFLSVSAFFGPGVDGVQDKLVTLAEHVIDRL